ncbi:hypothetical protein BDP27DRAFT_1230948, partial [Rhodocollybia butyracea]
LCDWQGRRIVYCIGRPRDENWMREVNEEVICIVEKGRKNAKFTAKQLDNRRGPFPAEAIRYSHSGGQPSNTKHSARNLKVLETILANPAICRLSGIANSAYKRFCPGMYEEYQKNSDALRAWKPSLCQNFKNTVFAVTTVNFGPQVIADDHVDNGNFGPGGCTISNAGNFNDHKGGEMVLWNLGVIIHSALIRHQNLPIQPGKSRYLITQYSAGALFQYVANGFLQQQGSFGTSHRAEERAIETRECTAVEGIIK